MAKATTSKMTLRDFSTSIVVLAMANPTSSRNSTVASKEEALEAARLLGTTSGHPAEWGTAGGYGEAPCLPSSTPHHQLLPRQVSLPPSREAGRAELGVRTTPSPERCPRLGLAAPPVTPCPGLGRCYECSLSPRSRPLGQQGKGRAREVEPAIRSGDTALQGSRGPHATRTSTGQSHRKLSPLLARQRPPYSRRRIRDRTERRRGQAARRASSARPGSRPLAPPMAAGPWPRP
uniref:Uncharacterized protein n=1 Tax=Rangifer tarandus platyrhynchus TaxID=3082113 RepID=A0ACB0EFZ2_RANTA|nr:unnamed protein product [Rangifer tarandus platyrhynchus]